MHLHLSDAGDLHLDRILERDDVAVRRADLLDRGVEGVGLARAGRTGQQDQSLCLGQRGGEQFELCRIQSGAAEHGHVVGPGEQSDDDLLAVQCRQGRDAGLDDLAVDGELGASVLRAASLGDVQAGHDLHPADRRGRGVAWHRHDVSQQAVHPVADAQLTGLRLDVHVTGPGAYGIGQHDIDEADDRRSLHTLRRDLLDLVLGGVHPLEQGVHIGGVLGQAPCPRQVVADLARGRHQHDHLACAGVELDVVEGHDVRGISCGDGDPRAAPLGRDDQHAGPLGDRPGQQPDGLGLRHGAAEVDHRKGEGLGEGVGDLHLGREAAVDDEAAEALSRPDTSGLLPTKQLAELVGREQTLGDEDLADPSPVAARSGHGVVSGRCHGVHLPGIGPVGGNMKAGGPRDCP